MTEHNADCRALTAMSMPTSRNQAEMAFYLGSYILTLENQAHGNPTLATRQQRRGKAMAEIINQTRTWTEKEVDGLVFRLLQRA